MRIRQLAVTTGLAVALVATAAVPASTALASERPRPVTSVSEPGDDHREARSFGAVTSYDAQTGVLVVATDAGGTLTATVTGRTAVKLLGQKPAKAAKSAVKGKSQDKAKQVKDKAATTPAARRAAALAALVPGADLRFVLLDPRSGELRAVVVAAAAA